MPALPDSKIRGFSLLELLTGMAVLLLLVVLLGQIVSQVSHAWSTGEARKERLQNLRTITDFMGKELQAAMLPLNRTDRVNLRFAVNPAGLSGQFYNRDAIFWQAPFATDSSRGEIAIVGYFVRWVSNPGAAPKPILCRLFIDPTDTQNYQIYAPVWLSDEILNRVAPASSASGYQGMVAENVVGLWIRCLDAYGQPIALDHAGLALANHAFDSSKGYTDSGGKRSADYVSADGSRQPYCVLPKAVEVSLAMIDSPSAARLNANSQQAIMSLVTMAESADQFISAVQSAPALEAFKPGLKSYQTRIFLQNSK